MNYGEFQGVQVRDGEPIFDPAPVVMTDVKLDKTEDTRAELELRDFELRGEVLRLMHRLDELSNGVIQRVEVRAGIPRRVVFQSRLKEPM